MTPPRKGIKVHPVNEHFQVVTVTGGGCGHQKRPCPKCPWRKDATGEFPAGAFLHSARTAYDMSEHQFACHQSGVGNTKACAGFILRGADHNLGVRLRRIKGQDFSDVQDGGHELYSNYREMAIGNGVDPDDPVLAPCRD